MTGRPSVLRRPVAASGPCDGPVDETAPVRRMEASMPTSSSAARDQTPTSVEAEHPKRFSEIFEAGAHRFRFGKIIGSYGKRGGWHIPIELEVRPGRWELAFQIARHGPRDLHHVQYLHAPLRGPRSERLIQTDFRLPRPCGRKNLGLSDADVEMLKDKIWDEYDNLWHTPDLEEWPDRKEWLEHVVFEAGLLTFGPRKR